MAELLSSDPQHTAGLVSGGFSEAAFEAFLSQRAALLGRQEPAWLQAMRREAWQAFLEMDFPSSRDEEWMRTDIRLLRLERFGFPQPLPPGTEPPAALLVAPARGAEITVWAGLKPSGAANGADAASPPIAATPRPSCLPIFQHRDAASIAGVAGFRGVVPIHVRLLGPVGRLRDSKSLAACSI